MATTEELESLREWLQVPEKWEDEYLKFKGLRTPGTCEWIFEETAFKDWMNGKLELKSTLSIYGKSGMGKSILAATIVDRLQNGHCRAEDLVVSVFCQPHATPHDILLSFVYQLLRKDDWARRSIDVFRNRNPGVFPAQMSFFDLWHNLFAQCIDCAPVRALGQRRFVYCVIDGLDNCDSHLRPSLIRQLSSSVFYLFGGIPRFLLFSRSNLGFTIARGFESFTTIEITRFDIENDKSRFIESEVRRLVGSLKGHEPPLMVSMLKFGGDGTFLWCKNVLDKLATSRDTSSMLLEVQTSLNTRSSTESQWTREALEEVLKSTRSSPQTSTSESGVASQNWDVSPSPGYTQIVPVRSAPHLSPLPAIDYSSFSSLPKSHSDVPACCLKLTIVRR
jgi:hypothetical protein